jgi:soluble lytic murein transglycosylase-like protein
MPTDLGALSAQIAQSFGIPVNIFQGVIQNESGATGAGGPIDPSTWNPQAVSPVGAQGLGQLMPGTAAGLGVTNPFDPTQNLTGSAQYLSSLYKQIGSWTGALQAYNAGPGAYAANPNVSAGYASNVLKSAGVTGANTPGIQPAGATGTTAGGTPSPVSGAQPPTASSGLTGTVLLYGIFIVVIIVLVIAGIAGAVKS